MCCHLPAKKSNKSLCICRLPCSCFLFQAKYGTLMWEKNAILQLRFFVTLIPVTYNRFKFWRPKLWHKIIAIAQCNSNRIFSNCAQHAWLKCQGEPRKKKMALPCEPAKFKSLHSACLLVSCEMHLKIKGCLISWLMRLLLEILHFYMEQKIKSHALNRSSTFRQNAKHAKMLWMIDWWSAVCMIAFALQICPRWLRTAPPTRVLTRLSCACQVICYHRFIISKSHPCIIIFHQRRHDLTITITDVGLPYCSSAPDNKFLLICRNGIITISSSCLYI